MIILTIKTDNPQAEIGLYDGDKQLAIEKWQARRQLAETLHHKIKSLLKSQQKDWPDIKAIVVFKGPGSFTGLRIGLSVGNALAQGLQVPVVGQEGKDWVEKGLQKLKKGQDEDPVMPEYGSPVHTTLARK